MADTTVSLVGNLTRPFELRFSQSGNAIASSGLAINTRTKDVQGNWEDGEPQFYDIVLFGSLAEGASESLDKGHRVVVVGKLNYNTWTTDDGDRRSKIEVIGDAIGPDLRWQTCNVIKNTKS